MAKRLIAAILAAASLAAGPAAMAQWRPGGRMRIVVLVDSSATVSTMINAFRAGLNGFLDALPGEPEIAIVSTGGQLRIRAGPTTDRLTLHEAASRFTSDGGGNAFLDTLLEADARLLKSAPDRRSVFVILATDMGTSLGEGRVDAYRGFVDDFVARGGRAHAIIVQGLNTGLTTRIAENLTRNTGGFSETVKIATAVPKLMKTLADYVAADQ